jgi:hypothetical protein
LEANTKAPSATSSSTLGSKHQGEQSIVTTTLASPIKEGTNSKFIPLPLSIIIIVVPIVTPSLVVSSRIEPLKLL